MKDPPNYGCFARLHFQLHALDDRPAVAVELRLALDGDSPVSEDSATANVGGSICEKSSELPEQFFNLDPSKRPNRRGRLGRRNLTGLLTYRDLTVASNLATQIRR